MTYTDDQIADIKAREATALVYLKEHNLSPAVSMQMVNLGDDNFAIKPFPYLMDTKFTPTPSPDEFRPPVA